jgi:hypothetical protein
MDCGIAVAVVAVEVSACRLASVMAVLVVQE